MEKQAAAAAQEQEQWEGVVEATLPSTPATAAWPHIASFCSLNRYLPGIDVCELAEGEDGRPGCVRYVASLAPGTTTAGEVGSWAREKLLEMDDDARRLAYAVVGSNMGFGRYVATMSIVVVVADQEEEDDAGCKLVWAFECDPVVGWTRDGLLGYLDGGVKAIAARIEEAHAAGSANAGDGGDNNVVVVDA